MLRFLLNPFARALVAFALAALLMFSQSLQRDLMLEAERSKIMRSNTLSWAVSELISDGTRLSSSLLKYSLYLEDRQEVVLSLDLFWSRHFTVVQQQFLHLPDTGEAITQIEGFLENTDALLKSEQGFDNGAARRVQADLESVLSDVRRAWASEFNSREFSEILLEDQLSAHLSHEGKHWWHSELVTNVLLLLITAYISSELFFAQRARRIEQRLRKKAVVASEAKAMFLANVSHEIRTPLNGILGMTEHLRESTLTADQSASLDVITDSGKVLLSTISDVLDLSKLEAGQFELVHEPFCVREAAQRSVELYIPLGLKKGVEVLCEVEGDVPLQCEGDAHRLRQILHNLISNAVKFTQVGHVRLRVSYQGSADQSAGFLSFEVEDTGIGISQDATEAIFRPFQQAHTHTSRDYGGTGLGLSISRELAQNMGATLTVHSVRDQGSVFCLRVCMKAVEVVNAPIERPSDSSGSKLPLAVLGVDDNATNRMILERFLKPEVQAFTLADSGPAAIAACSEAWFDVILMDIRMPGMNGIETLRAIRALQEGQPHQSVIIAVTANGSDAQIAEYLSEGMDAVLSKPISKRALLTQLSECIVTTSITGKVA